MIPATACARVRQKAAVRTGLFVLTEQAPLLDRLIMS